MQFKVFDELADAAQVEDNTVQGWWNWARKKVSGTGYARGSIDNSFTGIYWLMSTPKDRTPNAYHDASNGEVTEEYVHPSVHYRRLANEKYKEDIYEPAAMRGWTRKYEPKGKASNGTTKFGWMWVKYFNNDPEKGIEHSMWEFEIGGMSKDKSLEKRLIDKSWVDAVHTEVESDWKKVRA